MWTCEWAAGAGGQPTAPSPIGLPLLPACYCYSHQIHPSSLHTLRTHHLFYHWAIFQKILIAFHLRLTCLCAVLGETHGTQQLPIGFFFVLDFIAKGQNPTAGTESGGNLEEVDGSPCVCRNPKLQEHLKAINIHNCRWMGLSRLHPGLGQGAFLWSKVWCWSRREWEGGIKCVGPAACRHLVHCRGWGRMGGCWWRQWLWEGLSHTSVDR